MNLGAKESINKLWDPSPSFKEESNLNAYIRWLKTHKGLQFKTYHDLWFWWITS